MAAQEPAYRDICGKCGAKRIDRQIGKEPTPEVFVEKIVEVFREVRRVLHPSGTVFLNLGDAYFGGGRGGNPTESPYRKQATNVGSLIDSPNWNAMNCGLKPKDLCMIPWRVALALQADGWWVRSVICWHKKSCMPESVTDRPTNSWEPIFLLTKRSHYFYDAEAVKEPAIPAERLVTGKSASYGQAIASGRKPSGNGVPGSVMRTGDSRNQRNVWSLGPEPYSEAHFATFPTEIPRRAILAGTSARGCCPKCREPWVRVVESSKTFESGSGRAGNLPNGKQDLRASDTNSTPDIRMGPVVATRTVGWEPGCECDAGEPIHCTVLDPFLGSGTTAAVAIELRRLAIGIELNQDYFTFIRDRVNAAQSVVDAFEGVGTLFEPKAIEPDLFAEID